MLNIQKSVERIGKLIFQSLTWQDLYELTPSLFISRILNPTHLSVSFKISLWFISYAVGHENTFNSLSVFFNKFFAGSQQTEKS